MKRISVITSGLNAGLFIADCVNSIKESVSEDKFELQHVYIDDGSTDNTAEIVNANIYPGLKYIKLDRNYGPAEARNRAVSQTDCDYLFHLDADDVMFQNSLKYLFMAAEEKKVPWVYGDFLRANKDLIYKQGEDYYGWTFQSVSETLQSMFTGWHFFQGNCLYSRALFDQVHGFNPDLRIGEDFELFTKFLLADEYPRHVPATLYLHREHGKNLTSHFTPADHKVLHQKSVQEIFGLHSKEITNRLTEEGKVWVSKYVNV